MKKAVSTKPACLACGGSRRVRVTGYWHVGIRGEMLLFPDGISPEIKVRCPECTEKRKGEVQK